MVYPNPFNTQATISFSEHQKNTIIAINDFLGREVQTMNFTGIELTISRKEMRSGLYFLTITDVNNHTEIRKLIIQ
ncbi:MAG: T9SS type A sorting domain-containing protein [Bacteroidetes bacterium]|nr:T9SS type A sorting domain-containing protein [Bacteroidota bacterium]